MLEALAIWLGALRRPVAMAHSQTAPPHCARRLRQGQVTPRAGSRPCPPRCHSALGLTAAAGARGPHGPRRASMLLWLLMAQFVPRAASRPHFRCLPPRRDQSPGRQVAMAPRCLAALPTGPAPAPPSLRAGWRHHCATGLCKALHLLEQTLDGRGSSTDHGWPPTATPKAAAG
jgi:hypothetical protein